MNILTVITDVLQGSERQEEDFIEGLAYLSEEPGYTEIIIKDEQLLNQLTIRHSVGRTPTRVSIYSLWNSVFKNASMESLLTLFKLYGVLEMLVEGIQTQHSVEAIEVSLKAL
jgi:hypothetical protein